MDLKIPKFDELKDRLGNLTGSASQPRSSSRKNDVDAQGFDDFGYEDYGEYGFDDSADYSQPAATTSSSAYTAQMPKLVSMDDVRAHTQYTPAEPEPETQPQRRAPRDLSSMGSEQSYRSPGANSLFQPSEPQAAPVQSAASQTQGFSTGSIPAVAPAATEQNRVTQRQTRIITTIKPESYADAERIVKVLRGGDVAVVSLRNTPEQLGKRILDFCFGVACAMDAQVECVSGHVFAFTRGAGLSDAEASRLKGQGLM